MSYDVFYVNYAPSERIYWIRPTRNTYKLSTTINNNNADRFNTKLIKAQCSASCGSNKYASRYRIKTFHYHQCNFQSNTYKSLYYTSYYTYYIIVIKIFNKPDCQVV